MSPFKIPSVLIGCLISLQDSAEPRLVIAIDFGTFASGYAFQWRTDFESDPLNIHANTVWTANIFCTYKTPTAILLDVCIVRIKHKVYSSFVLVYSIYFTELVVFAL